MNLYFYNRKVYPSKEQPAYYNVTKGLAGFVDKQEGVCLYEGTLEDFEALVDESTPNNHQRSRRRTNRLPLD